MTQPARDRRDRHTGGQHPGSDEVAEVVQPDAGNTQPVAQPDERAVTPSGRHGTEPSGS